MKELEIIATLLYVYIPGQRERVNLVLLTCCEKHYYINIPGKEIKNYSFKKGNIQYSLRENNIHTSILNKIANCEKS